MFRGNICVYMKKQTHTDKKKQKQNKNTLNMTDLQTVFLNLIQSKNNTRRK